MQITRNSIQTAAVPSDWFTGARVGRFAGSDA
jgi:hypothetical protein